MVRCLFERIANWLKNICSLFLVAMRITYFNKHTIANMSRRWRNMSLIKFSQCVCVCVCVIVGFFKYASVSNANNNDNNDLSMHYRTREMCSNFFAHPQTFIASAAQLYHLNNVCCCETCLHSLYIRHSSSTHWTKYAVIISAANTRAITLFWYLSFTSIECATLTPEYFIFPCPCYSVAYSSFFFLVTVKTAHTSKYERVKFQ